MICWWTRSTTPCWYWNGSQLGADCQVTKLLALNDLTDVGDVPTRNLMNLADLDDVAVDGVVDEQVLVYDGNQGKLRSSTFLSAASLAEPITPTLKNTPSCTEIKDGTVANSAGDFDAEHASAN